jgi:glycosidase
MKIRTLKQLLILCLLTVYSPWANAQLVWTTPVFPVENDSVIVYFDATQGSGGLAGYTGEVYAHTGVITDHSTSSSDWKYVKTAWGENIPATHLQRIATNTYKLAIGPDIRSYYNVPQNEKILQLAFVFRSAAQVNGSWIEGKTETGGDIFINVYETGLHVTINLPDKNSLLVNLGEQIPVEVQANLADSVHLLVNGIEIKMVAGNLLTDTITALAFGKYWVKTIATNNTGAVADSFYYFVRRPLNIAELPSGVKDGINYIDDSTVILSLFAPYKQSVFVLGDFNNWEYDSLGCMNRTIDQSRYWLKIEHLIPGKEYVFQYDVDGQIRIGDPYADKTSDPWNDQYIPASVYPNLVVYPAGKLSGIATILQTAQPTYTWQNTNFSPPSKTNLVIYEMLVRDFVTTHNYQTLTDTLSYLKRLGINAIELMPVNEFEGNSSWGYNPSFYFAPDKYYGPKNSLKRFVDECHAKGIAVFIDLVLNHAYDQCPLVQLYFDGDKPTAQNPWFNVNSNFTNPDAQWGNDFNHESIYTQQLVDSINSYWISEYKIDGFRFDFTKGFGNNIKGTDDPWGSNYDADRIALLKRMAHEIWVRKSDAFVVFEHLSVNEEEKELANYGILLWGNMSNNYEEAAMGWTSTSDLSGASYKNRGWNDPNLVVYMESHDEERLMFKNIKYGNSTNVAYNLRDTITALQRQELAALFFFTIPGPKMVWQFGELGYDYSIEYNGRVGEKPVRWDYLNHFQRRYLNKFYSTLIHLKTTEDLFETRNFTLSVAGAAKRINLTANGKSAAIIGNFDVKESSINPAFSHTGYWYDYFSGDSINVTSTTAAITLGLGEYHLYTDFHLAKPEIGTGISNVEPSAESSEVILFPNPSSGKFSLSYPLTTLSRVRIDLYNLNGKHIVTLFDKNRAPGIQMQNFDLNTISNSAIIPGIYLIQVNSEGFNSYVKLVLNP